MANEVKVRFNESGEFPRVVGLFYGLSIGQRVELAQASRSPALLSFLAEEPNGDVLMAVAENQFTTPATLDLLSRKRDPWVRVAVTLNENTAMGTLVRLTHDLDKDVRESAREIHKQREEQSEKPSAAEAAPPSPGV